MANRVGQWGGSLSVRLPKNVVEALSIKKGDGLRIFVGPDHTIHIRPVKPVPADGMPTVGAAPAEPEEPTQW
ncbi:AbrB/MazE/SpoVT family DNA-binding domain-containing protein [Diaphorobacter sp. JS3050]|uniref:AbrB/MazE/SpoVT family DNA-binding domain-containing protein n=1 Tax=Diaphorobacter sp. JS3050 TaxID=2735554 RepID=UPI0015544ED8|nr:AbrB/MazE/SpoVT family DNA-binding domain-containing protein [Diaphorobacter sp. JS3050]QJY33665.1 AbrB/MazE/SpoVT family DNA-binding domain-containing protein [Diaphorobacter sp. JS3050]